MCHVLHYVPFHTVMLSGCYIVILHYITLPSALKFDVKSLLLHPHRAPHWGQKFKEELVLLNVNTSGAVDVF